MAILVTGAAGFIGYHTAEALLARGDEVIGLDNLNDYYDPALKRARLARLMARPAFRFVEADVADRGAMARIFAEARPDRVVHLAAQAGVRYSLANPYAYVDSNLAGFITILEGCRAAAVRHLVFASSSSVYGANAATPFSVADNVDHPLNLYAASKKANELMAHAYAHLYRLPVTGLRFFTVYGPWGRPDMALYIFTRAMLAGQPVQVFNQGNHARDFTYIDDIVHGVVAALDHVAAPDPAFDAGRPRPDTSSAPYRIYNIGNSSPVGLMDLIGALERALGLKAEKVMLPMQAGDVVATWADVSALEQAVGFKPATPIDVGVGRFVAWYRSYHGG
jgi:UDP-glucuronate 4-epimerase